MKETERLNVIWVRGREGVNVKGNSLAAVSAKTPAGDTARRG